jgi:hypothetical protein
MTSEEIPACFQLCLSNSSLSETRIGGDRSVICFGMRPGRISARRRRVPVPAAATPGDRGVLQGLRTVSAAGLVCLSPDGRGRLLYRMRIHRGRKGERRGMFEADYPGLTPRTTRCTPWPESAGRSVVVGIRERLTGPPMAQLCQ